jgi:hypothetical protein
MKKSAKPKEVIGKGLRKSRSPGFASDTLNHCDCAGTLESSQVPDLTRSAGIKLNERLSLRPHLEAV